MTLVPLQTRQTMFQTLLETAMWPLSALGNPSNLHAKHVTQNVRRILKQGGGLPLLFPKYELGFGYNNDTVTDDSEDWTQDTMGYIPTIEVGYLLPHVELQVETYSKELFPNLQVLNETGTNAPLISSSDLPSQLRVAGPCFALLLLNNWTSLELVHKAVEATKLKCGVEIRIVQVIAAASETPTLSDLVVRDVDTRLSSMIATSDPVMILIRPDGHVASVAALRDDGDESISNGKYATVLPAKLVQVVQQGVFDSLGIVNQ